MAFSAASKLGEEQGWGVRIAIVVEEVVGEV
jgi:hypothetical protein